MERNRTYYALIGRVDFDFELFRVVGWGTPSPSGGTGLGSGWVDSTVSHVSGGPKRSALWQMRAQHKHNMVRLTVD